MLSLAYRIATMTAIYPKGVEEASQLVVYSKVAIKSAVKIRAQNVSDFLLSKPSKLDVSKDIPNWMPPFEICFIEFSTPMEDEYDPEKQVICQSGAIVHRMEYDGQEGAVSPDAKWQIAGVSWCCMVGGRSSLSGKPMLLGTFNVFTNHNGHCLDCFFNGFEFDVLKDIRSKILSVAGMTCSFMHCKNVRQVETKEDPGERFRKQYGVPKYTYRTLQIDPMKEVLRREGKSDSEGLKRALHICRGHFSTYSEEKPLFGKYPGTFWVPDHVRGSKERGEVVKDYNVKPTN